MPKAVVLFDLIAWMDDDVRHEAEKGETVDLPTIEFERLKDLGAVAAPGSKDAKAALSDEPEAEPTP